MRFEGGERFAERFAGGSDAIEKFVGFEVIKDGVARCSGNRMRLIGEAVHEGGGALFEGVDDAGSDEDRAEGRVTAGDPLAREKYVGCEAPVRGGAGLACA